MRVFGHRGGDQTADLGKRAMTLRVLLCNWDQHRCSLVKDQREGKQRKKGKPFLVKVALAKEKLRALLRYGLMVHMNISMYI